MNYEINAGLTSMTFKKTDHSAARSVLIAGGAGFIGSHLCDHYIDHGWTVWCLDSLKTGSVDNIKHLQGNPNFHFVNHDIISPYSSDQRFELILNFACPASPVRYQADPLHTVKTSFLGTMNLLDLAKAQNCRVLHASTSEVYGDPLQHPQPESYWGNVNTIGPRSCYDEGKRVAETLCRDYHHLYGTDIRVIRIFNTYGPRMALDDGRVVCNFITQVLEGKPITIYGDGSQTRSFCYVSDLVAGIVKYAALAKPFFGPVNLGNDGEFTMLELAATIMNLAGKKVPFENRPLPTDDPRARRPQLTLAKSLLNWAPEVPLAKGLELSIPYFRKALGQS